jgi:lipopolysaccharide transport system permease protein
VLINQDIAIEDGKRTPEEIVLQSSDREFSHFRIEPSNGFVPIKYKELWEYRELFYFLVWRDIKVRYKQTALGASWAIIQPVLTMIVFSIFFGKLGKIPSDGVPYPIFSFAALVPWVLFSNGLTQATGSVVGSSNLIKKVYFPRLIIPIASVLAGVVDFFLAFGVLLLMMLYFGILPTINILWLPVFLFMTIAASLAVSLWFSALNVEYRDIKYVIPFLSQIWLFATPIAYSSSLLSEPWRTIYGLNPMVGVVEGFRWALLGTNTQPGVMALVSLIASLVLLISGAYYFRRMEKTFADRI